MKQTEAGTGLFFILFPLPFALCAPRRTLPKFSQSSRKRFACKLFSWRVELPIPAFIMESERHAVLTPFLSFGKAVKRSNECIDQASFVYSVSYLNNSGFLWVFMLK